MRLRELRTSKNLSQSELSKVIGVSGQTILNWENGIYEPKIKHLIDLADYFGVTVDYLIERETVVSITDILSIMLKKVPYDEIINFICDYIKNNSSTKAMINKEKVVCK